MVNWRSTIWIGAALAVMLLCALASGARAVDSDRDGVADDADNCPAADNPEQFDRDGDGIGNACDVCLERPEPIPDEDGDTIGDDCDDCPGTVVDPSSVSGGMRPPVNEVGCALSQLCPCAGPRGRQRSWRYRAQYVHCIRKRARGLRRRGVIGKEARRIMVAEAVASNCGRHRRKPGDSDGDGIRDDGDESGFIGDHRCKSGNTTECDDNCRFRWNPKQRDTNGDATGDVCDRDDDGDGIRDGDDNCPRTKNADQKDGDDDGVGDACDECPGSDADDDVNGKGCS